MNAIAGMFISVFWLGFALLMAAFGGWSVFFPSCPVMPWVAVGFVDVYLVSRVVFQDSQSG